MDSIKWKCKNWIVYLKTLDNFQLFHLIVEKLGVQFFSIVITNLTLTCEIWTRFFKKYIKSGNVTEEKQDLKDF